MLIYKGAEAELHKEKYLGFEVVEKRRIPKEYRIKEIDEKIRKERTKYEANVLTKVKKYVNVPTVFDLDTEKMSITMEFINGEKLRDLFYKKKSIEKMRKIGEYVKRLHDKNIIHGDLTTSNLILEKEIYFIDFGLAFNSDKLEDKAVDVLTFKKMLKSTHFNEFKKIWDLFKKGYKDEKVFKKIKEIESRARYA